MTKTFFCIKQGGRPSLGTLAGEDLRHVLIDPPSFFLPYPAKVLMKIKPPYEDVPFAQEKLNVRKRLAEIYQATIATLEASEPDYPTLPYVKEQLKRELETWADVTGGQPCQ